MANPTIVTSGAGASTTYTVTGSSFVAIDIALADLDAGEAQVIVTAPMGAVIMALRSPANWTAPGIALLTGGAWAGPQALGNWNVTIMPGAAATDPATVKFDAQIAGVVQRLRLICTALGGPLTVEPAAGNIVIDRVLAAPAILNTQVLNPPLPVREHDAVTLSASVQHSKVDNPMPAMALSGLPPLLSFWATDLTNPAALPSFMPSGSSAAFTAPAVYAPTTLKFNLAAVLDLAANGTIEMGDPVTTASLSLTVEQVTYGMVLVLDRSGSMGEALGGGMSKWTAAVRAAHAWADLFRAFRPGGNHLAGVVTFQSDSGAWTLTPDSQITFRDPSSGNPVVADPLKPLAGFGDVAKWNLGSDATATPIGDGLVKAWTSIGAKLSPGNKAAVVLMTDGYENSGAVTIAATKGSAVQTFATARTTSLNAGNTYIGNRLYTLALGTQVDDTRLHVLGEGFYRQITNSVNEVGPAFAEMLGHSLQADPVMAGPPMAADPEAPAQALYYKVSSGERVLALLVQWADNTHALRVGYRPQGSVDPFILAAPTPNKVTVTLRESHGLMRVDLAALLGDGAPATEWRLQDVVGVTPQTGLVDRAIVMVDLVTKVDVGFSKPQFYVGEPIGLETRIACGGAAVTGATVLIDSARPGESLGTYLTLNARRYKDLNDDIPRPKSDAAKNKGLMVKTLFDMDGLQDLPIVRASGLALKDDGAHADGSAGDGFYANTFAATETEGTYTFRFRVEGSLADGSQFARVFERSVWVGLRPDPAQLNAIWQQIGQGNGSTYRSSFTFKPMYGTQYLGPFQTDAIQLKISGGTFDGDLVDLIDGSYTINVLHQSKDMPTVSVNIWGQDMAPSAPSPTIAPLGTNCWQLWLSAIRCTLIGLRKLFTGK